MGVRSGAIQDWRRKNKYSLAVEEGVVVAVTRVFKPPQLFSRYAPYWVGVVELKGSGERMVGQLVGEAKIGDAVKATRRILWQDGENGVIHYGIKWEKA